MPIYTLRCRSCGRVHDEMFLRPASADEVQDLEMRCECGGYLEKAPAKCTFRMKGRGWAAMGRR